MYWLVAIAYLLHKTPYVFYIVGGRKVEHLKQNIQALDISLSPEQIHRMDDAKPIDLGFPRTAVVRIPIGLTIASPAKNMNREMAQQTLNSLKC